jgi:uncharacterized membrane protein
MRCPKAMFITLCLALSLEARVQAGYIFTTLTPPDSERSSAYGINDEGDVVGSYYGPSGRSLNGFAWSNGVYTPIAYGPPPFLARMSRASITLARWSGTTSPHSSTARAASR